MSKYICLYVYICLLPAVILITDYLWNISIIPYSLTKNDGIAVLIMGLGLLFIPALFWFIMVKIFKNIHPLITIPFFMLFVVLQLIILFFSVLFGIIGFPEMH